MGRSNIPVETGAAMAKAAMERTVATMVVNFILTLIEKESIA